MFRALVIFSLLAAASPADAQIRTLDECIRVALATHPSVAAADATVDAARESAGAALSAFYPVVTASADYTRFETHAFLPSGIPITAEPMIGPTDNWGGGVGLRFTLYDHGTRRAEVAAARAVESSTVARAAATRDDVVYAVHTAYWQLAAALQMKRAAQAGLDRAAAHLQIAQHRLDAGAVPPIDVVRARTSVANARLALANARSAADLARGALNSAIGVSPDTPLQIDAGAAEAPTTASNDISAALDRAVARRPELRAARERERAQRATADAARAARGPKVRLGAGYGVRDSKFLPDDRDWHAGVAVEVPLFDGYATRHREAGARAELRRQEADTAVLLVAIRQEVWSASASMRQRSEAVHAAEAAQVDAAEAARLAEARYDGGAGTISDLLDAEAALLQADADLVRARFDERLASTSFRRATGELIPAP